MNICNYCGKTTKNAKYCSKSCSASANNKTAVRRKPEGKCRSCATPIKTRFTWCEKCKPKGPIDMTLKEAIYDRHHRSSAYALIRSRARSVVKPKPCYNCGYEKHTEVCHIKAISDFDENTKLSVINDPSNLVRLCPNCHWEFDRGILKLKSIARSN